MCLQVKCACGVYSAHGGVSMYGVKVHAFGCGMRMYASVCVEWGRSELY